MTSPVFKVMRATTKRAWWDETKPAAEYDLSDHHPCRWEVNGLKGLTYNVQFLPKPIADTVGKSTDTDIRLSAQLIAEWITKKDNQYDVLCLQELFDSTATTIIEAALLKKGYQATERLGGAILGTPTSGGVRIFARKELQIEDMSGCIYRHKVDYLRRGDAFVDKGVKHAIVNKNGQRYHVLNTHLQASYNDPSHQHYVEVALAQLLELKQYIDNQKTREIILETDHIVLCGDFNIPKNALGEKLDEVSKRGDALFKRAQILLGSEFHHIQSDKTIEGQPTHSFDPQTNTYLTAVQETMSADLDLVFTVDPQHKPPHNPFLEALVRNIQAELSLYVQYKVSGFGNQLSPQDQAMINATSIALDNFILGERSENLYAISTQLEKFSQLLPDDRQIEMEHALTGAMIRKVMNDPNTLPRLKRCLNQCIEKKLGHQEKQCMRMAMQRLRTAISIQEPTDISAIEIYINKMKSKAAIDSALKAIKNQGIALKTRWNHCQEASSEAYTLYKSLKKAAHEYFQFKGTDKQEFKKACEAALDAKHIAKLKNHRGIWGVIGSFIHTMGELFNWHSWIQKGKSILETPTASMKLIGLFKNKIDEIVEPHSNEPSPHNR